MVSQVVQTSSKFLSKGFSKYFKFFFIFLFLIIPLIYAVIMSIQARDISVGVNYFMPKLLKPTLTIGEQSKLIIENNGAVVQTENTLLNIWKFITFYWILIGAIWIFYKWIWLFASLIGVSPFSNTSEKFRNYTLSFLLVSFLQVIYLLITKSPENNPWEVIKIPFMCWWNLILASPYLITYANQAIGEDVNQTIKVVGQNITNITN